MSLLSSLLEYSGGLQPSSLLFCQSPKEQAAKEALEKRNVTRQPQRNYCRPSKSLTKMSMYSSDTKIDPKERLLHRLAYKLEMKCRKHYYNFFVKLQNMYKKAQSSSKTNTKGVKNPGKMLGGVQKLCQVQAILFSKYFETAMKKGAFKQVVRFACYKAGLSIVSQKFFLLQKQIALAKLYNFSKKAQKYQMRIEILLSSAQNIISSRSSCLKKDLLNQSWLALIQYAKRKNSQARHNFSQIQNHQSSSNGKKSQPIGKLAQIEQIYNALKSKVSSTNNSPCKQAKQIELLPSLPQRINNSSYLKACKFKTKLFDYPFQTINELFFNTNLSKRCDNDPLTSKQVNDIYDNNTLFFPFEVKPQAQSQKLITQSSVQSVHFDDNCFSQFSCVAPLQEFHDKSRVSTATRNGKSNSFGSDAVSFKNSLVYERESMKIQDVFANVNNRRDETLEKAKNFIKQSRKVQEEYAQSRQVLSRVENRYQSAEKDLITSKAKNRRQSTGSLVPPYVQTMPFSLAISPHVHIAQHDYGKAYQTSRTSKAESFTSSQKQSSRRPSFIKLNKKG